MYGSASLLFPAHTNFCATITPEVCLAGPLAQSLASSTHLSNQKICACEGSWVGNTLASVSCSAIALSPLFLGSLVSSERPYIIETEIEREQTTCLERSSLANQEATFWAKILGLVSSWCVVVLKYSIV